MAITNEAHIRVKIDGKDTEISVKDMGKAIETAMRRGKKEADKLKTSFTKIGDAAQRFYFSFQSLKIFARGAMDFINAANKQEMAVAGMEQAFRSMGRYTETFSEQIQDLAKQIQEEGIIGDEAIIEGTKFLATYKDIANETMPRAMRVMADIAALMGGDVRQAANMVGKASMGMVGELRRAGITISEATMKSKDFNDILREIEEQVKGQNKALAETEAGALKQFRNAIGDLKEVGGKLMKMFIVPFTKILKPIVEWMTKLNMSTIGMVGTLGLAIATIWKLIPALKALGITSKLALGWISAIIIALELLYTAWTTNFLGIRDSLEATWQFMIQFYEKTKSWSERLGTIFKLLGEIFYLAFTGQFGKISGAVAVFFAELAAELDIEFKKIEKDIKKPGKTLIEQFGELGNESGQAFTRGFRNIIAGGPRGGAKPSIIEEMEELTEPGRSPFWDFIDMWDEMKNVGMATMDFLANSIQMLSNTMVQAMFNTKTKFKDLWQAMAMDFTRIFVNYVLGQLAKFLAIKVIANILPNIIAPGAGTVISAATFAPGFGATGAGGNQLSSIDNRLSNLETKLTGPVIINRIGSRQLYEAVSRGREIDLIRRGKDINKSYF